MAPSCSVGQTGRPGRGWSEGTARTPSSDAEDTGWSGGQGCAPESRLQSSPGHDPSQRTEEAGWLCGLGAGGPGLAELRQGLFFLSKGADSGKQEAASLRSLATQAHISSARVSPKWDGGGEVRDSSPLRCFLYRMTEGLAASGGNFWVVWLLLQFSQSLGTTVSSGSHPICLEAVDGDFSFLTKQMKMEVFGVLKSDCTRMTVSDGFPEYETTGITGDRSWKLIQSTLIKYLKHFNQFRENKMKREVPGHQRCSGVTVLCN